MQILKNEVRDRIVVAAAHEFVRYGYRLSSTRRIAKRARVGKSNLYNYFRSKEELFSAVTTPFHVRFDVFLAEVTSHVGGENLTSHAAEGTSRNIASFIRANKDAFVTIMDRSEGTKYEGYKEEVIDFLESHFTQHLRKEPAGAVVSRARFMHVVARLFLEALITIALMDARDEEVTETINLYLKYHRYGMSRFY